MNRIVKNMTNTHLKLTLLASLMVLLGKTKALPSSCTMDNLRVDCKNAGLDAVPDLPPNATDVDLSYNNITELRQDYFSNLPNLNRLSFNFNKISSIENGTFSSLGMLTSLLLSNNSLGAIGSETFKGLGQSFLMLGLMNNPDMLVAEGTFQSLPGLSQLLLMNFAGAGSYNFSHLINLDFLAAPECKLKDMNPMNFLGLSHLSRLDLSGNLLEEFPKEAIVQMPVLESLNLDGNKISKINGPLVEPHSPITSLTLEHNHLVSLHPDTFHGMTNLSMLTLSNNELMTLPKSIFSQLGNGSVDVQLEGNPIICDCNIRWLTSWLKVTNHNIDEVTCAFPLYLYQEKVENLTPDQFVCLPESKSVSVTYNVMVGGNVTLSNPLQFYEFTNYTWYTSCGSSLLEVDVSDTYFFGKDFSLIITDISPSICRYYAMVAENIAGKADCAVILEISGGGPNILVIALSAGVGVVGVIAIVAVLCHISRVRKFGRAMNMMRYNNLTEET